MTLSDDEWVPVHLLTDEERSELESSVDFEDVEPDGDAQEVPPSFEHLYERTAAFDELVISENQQLLRLMDSLSDPETHDVARFDGASGPADWLALRYRWSRHRARELVRVMSALVELPAIRGVFGAGGICWDQLRAVTRFATADTDAALAVAVKGLSMAEIAGLEVVEVDPVAEDQVRLDRYVRYWNESVVPQFGMTVKLTDADGAVVVRALQKAADKHRVDPDTDWISSTEAHMADALVEMASAYLADAGHHDRANVLVTVGLETLLGEGPAGRLGDRLLSNSTLQRLLCDSRIQMAINDPERGVVGVGRTTRSIPPWLARVIRARDQGCRFPRCERTRWVHIHHLIHWADLGPTDSDNLITLCGYHHRLLHADGWSISGDPNDDVQFIRPDGSPYTYREDHIESAEFVWLLREKGPYYEAPDRPTPRIPDG